MKIQNDAGFAAPSISGETAAGRIASQDKPSSSVNIEQPAADSVETSGIARQLEADPARLERLRQAVRSGTYQVPASELSTRIVNEHLDDASKRR